MQLKKYNNVYASNLWNYQLVNKTSCFKKTMDKSSLDNSSWPRSLNASSVFVYLLMKAVLVAGSFRCLRDPGSVNIKTRHQNIISWIRANLPRYITFMN
jgi:hypothetical protein